MTVTVRPVDRPLTSAWRRRLQLPLALAALSVPQALGLLLAMLTSVVVARAYGPSGKGAITAVTATVVFLAAVLNMSVGDSLAVQASRGLGPPRLRRALTLTWAAVAVPSVLIAALAAGPASRAVLVTVGTLLSALLTISAVASLGLRGPTWWAWGQVLQPTAFLAVVLIAAAVMAPTDVVVTGYISAVAVGVVVFWCWLPARTPSTDDDWQGMVRVLRYGALRHLANLGRLIISRGDLLMVAALAPAAQVGLYSVAYGTAELALWFSSSFAAMVFHAEIRPDAPLAPRMLLTAAVLSALPAALLASAAPGLLPFVYGEEFRSAVLPLLILLPGIVGLGVVNVLSAQFTARGRAGVIARISWLTAVPSLLVTPLLILSFGIVGAATATAMAYLLMATLTIRAHRRLLSVPP